MMTETKLRNALQMVLRIPGLTLHNSMLMWVSYLIQRIPAFHDNATDALMYAACAFASFAIGMKAIYGESGPLATWRSVSTKWDLVLLSVAIFCWSNGLFFMVIQAISLNQRAH